MKYTAIALMFGGLGTACFAIFMGTSPGPTAEGSAEPPGYLGFALLLAFAVVLLVAGALMLRFGGKGYTVSERSNAGSVNLIEEERPFRVADGAN